jgi:hypothetical protein
MPGASHTAVTSGVRPGRILLAEQQVLSVRSADSSTDTSATSCRTRTTQLSSRGRWSDNESQKANVRPRSACMLHFTPAGAG